MFGEHSISSVLQSFFSCSRVLPASWVGLIYNAGKLKENVFYCFKKKKDSYSYYLIKRPSLISDYY